MKKDRLKKYSLRFGIAFLIILALLTYFSSTVDNMLMPKVKTARFKYGALDGSESEEEKFQVPISSLVSDGDNDKVFCTYTDEETGITTVQEVEVFVTGGDELYYEVTGGLFSPLRVVYWTSKDIADGDRVYVEEE